MSIDTAAQVAHTQELLLQAASDPERTPFDYIVVGSGAGGGPLAARLAEAGKRVLLIEAGTDPATDEEPAPGPLLPGSGSAATAERAVYRVPALNGAATEDPRCNWSFSVRHYDSLARQQNDRKYRSAHDPSQPASGQPAEAGSGGILYPRSSALGGCTAHHAMIIVKPNDSDWNRIAALTGDPSWRAEVMQGYFTRIETCLYYEDYNGFLKGLVLAYRWLMRAAAFIHPRWQLDRGGHGRSGWQQTSFISPLLIRRIAGGDRGFLHLLLKTFWFLIREPGRLRALLRATLRGQLVQLLDPNFGSMRGGASGQAALIPVGTDGRQRMGLRERLLQVATAAPDRLVLLGGTLVTRVLFRAGEAAPRAQGVEMVAGHRLYQVGRASAAVPAHGPARACYAREEIILCGGAFNTPQLLMLSGIGEAQHLDAVGIQGPRDVAGRVVAPVVNLPGVGRNLQDRYEVAVISHARTAFSTLDGVTFDPDDAADPALLQWRQSGSGLYTTNGGAVAFFLQSGCTPSRDQPGTACADPDLFVFGVPAAFRGYYWGWSKQLLHDAMDADTARRDLWTWVLLKAYTDNNAGTVRLRSASAFHQPQITFHSFAEGPTGHASDVDALTWGIAFVRRLNAQLPLQQEVQPGAALQTGSEALRQWIRDEAWGHHACGTCRIGSDPWKADVRDLKDHGAVLDGHLRVQGVEGLRVCDASVFDRIPGYFIVTPVFMVSEKAADLLLAQSAAYPARLEAEEARAIRARRRIAQDGQQAAQPESAIDADNQLPPCTVGLALSGGGIRSATFALGLLQALARRHRLRQIDLMSTVSGGGYVGAFLGRLFTRVAGSVANPVERVERTLAQTGSDEMYWLRRHASYLLSAGRSDLQTHLGVMWRNLVTVHVVVGALLLALFTGLRWLGGASPAGRCAEGWLGALTCSPWWWMPVVLLGVAVIPMVTAYWLAPKPMDPPVTPWFSLLVWLVLVGAAVYALQWPDAQPIAAAALGVLLLGWIWQELVRHRRPPDTPAAEVGVIVRNRLSRGLGIGLLLTGAALGWVLLDSLARTVTDTMRLPVVGGMVLVNLLLPLGRVAWERARGLRARAADALPSVAGSLGIGVVAFTLATFLLFALDVLAHAAFAQGEQVGLYACAVALLLSWAIGRSTRFVNLSSLQAAYATRLARTFLGASNPARVHAGAGGVPPDVSEAHPQDDLPFTRYHPEQHGGPLHLVNVCVNETADAVTGRHLPEDKGLAMCLGPAGISVGVRYHALWNPSPGEPDAGQQRPAVTALPLGANPESFHVLGRDDGRPAAVEGLTLSQWMAISGAAFTTGAGRMTRLVVSLLYGLLNIRLGYWWNSGVAAADRPGRFPPTLWNRLLGAPGALFRTQRLLLNEWRGWFPGPAARYWYLSDGTHFENTGLYELVRRRTAFMIAVDGSEDPHYRCDEMAVLARRVRLDFGARIEWLEPAAASRSGDAWRALQQGDEVPAWIRDWLDPTCLGALSRVTRDGDTCAALARVRHADGTSSWLLLVKPCLGPFRESLDLRSYAAAHASFPHQPTYDQFFDDQQWESYRLLGELTGGRVFR